MPEDPERHDFARDLRQRMNEFEKALWDRLRDRKQRSFRFRRQHPLGPYTADFWCASVRVVVELDGFTHRERVEEDRRRDAWMAEQGILVLRFKNAELEVSVERVLVKIRAACEARMKK